MRITAKQSTKEAIPIELNLQKKQLIGFRNVFLNNHSSRFLSIFFNQLKLTYPLLTSIRQLSKLKRLKQRLKQFEQKFQAFMHTTLLHLLTLRKNTIHYINRKWMCNLGKFRVTNSDEKRAISDYIFKFEIYLRESINACKKNSWSDQTFNSSSEVEQINLNKIAQSEIEVWLAKLRASELKIGQADEHEPKLINFKHPCINCIPFVRNSSIFEVELYQNLKSKIIFPMKQLKMVEKDFTPNERDELEKIVCSIINARRGYILIGIDRFVDKSQSIKYYVVGIKGVNILANFTKQFLKFVQKYIKPKSILESCVNQMGGIESCFQISFIPVIENLSQIQNNHTKGLKCIQDQNHLFVIRIKIDFGLLDPKYLFYVQIPSLSQAKQKSNNFYHTVGNDEIQIKGEEVVKQIKQKYYTKREAAPQQKKSRQLYAHQPKIKCIQSLIMPNTNAKQTNFSVSFNRYGTPPVCTFDHESLLMVPKQGEEALKKMLAELNNRKIAYKYHVIYEKLPKNTPRSVYYITHEKKTEELIKIRDQLQFGNKQIHIAQIRKQFVLLNSDTWYRSFDHLKIHFKSQFKANIMYGFKEQTSQYFYYFANTTQATFSFVALEYYGIRCNFVNYSKMDSVHLEQF